MAFDVKRNFLKIFIKKFSTGESIRNKIIFGKIYRKTLKALKISGLTNINI
jgi:hypothetical protein